VTVELLRAAGIDDDALPWRDVLHEGPVPGGLAPDELAGVRARFLAESGWAEREASAGGATGRAELGMRDAALEGRAVEGEARTELAARDTAREATTGEAALWAELRARDAALAAWAERDEVVLWFEHDLYDQLQLLQVLDRLSCLGAPSPSTALALVTLDAHPAHPRFVGLGQLAPGELRPLWEARVPVGVVELDLGVRGWGAFTADDPGALGRLIFEHHPGLPFLAPALRRLLEEYPWVGDGLGRTERLALEALRDGAESSAEVFARVQEREAAPFMGDATLWRRLALLAHGPEPLLAGPEGAPPPPDEAALSDTPLRLTSCGRQVLAGEADRVALAGVDRWIGGVHLEGPEARWRWDPAGARLVRP
jgi:hypothetical protein